MKYVYGKKMRTLRDRLTTGLAALIILANSAGMSLPFLLAQKAAAATLDSSPRTNERNKDNNPLTLKGTIFHDRNSNHVKDKNEEFLSNWSVRIYKENLEGTWELVDTTTTRESDNNKYSSRQYYEAGIYHVCLINQPGWEQVFQNSDDELYRIVTDNLSGADDEGAWCSTVVYDDSADISDAKKYFGVIKSTTPKATLVAYKIVCDDESKLPNGKVTKPITENFAAGWVAQNEGCELVENWDYQYRISNSSDLGASGDHIGPLDGWTTFTNTADIELDGNTTIQIREILPENYLPFTGSDVSAEIYCHTDAANFDNWEWIQNPEAGATYYCVAWNVPTEPEVLTSNVQVCKEDQFGARLSGWQFALLGSIVDEKSVDSKYNTADNKVTSSLAAGSYVVKASGKFTYRVTRGVSYDADARFSYRLPGDASYGGPYVPWSTSNNGLLFLNNDNTVWGAVFNPSHIYYAPLTLAAPGSAQLYIGDNQYADNVGQLTIEIFEGYTGVTDETGCVTFEDVPYGTYTVEELMQKDWENISGLGDVEVQEPEVTVTVVNRNPETPKATVLATKIVCDAESYLPNWGSGNYGPITATTVDEFLATGDNGEFCRVVEWNFQWSVDGVGNPGDNKGEINDGNWNTFASSAEIDPSEAPLIWVREVANSDYIPFTGQNTTEDVSAEFYCADDVLHYDNWEFINLQPGQTYYCVAWNVLADHSGNNEETQNPDGGTVESDNDEKEDENNNSDPNDEDDRKGVEGAFTDIPSGGRGQGGPLVLGASTEGLTNTGYEVNLFAVIAGVTLGTALWINRRKPEQAK